MTILLACAVIAAPRGRGPNVHQPGSDCRTCHTADKATLDRSPAQARSLLRGDLEATCNRCHGDEGPSHQTGMKPTPSMKITPDLPLSSAGTITCATCHFMHGEDNRFGSFLRIDNRRGKLCLTCHKMSELVR